METLRNFDFGDSEKFIDQQIENIKANGIQYGDQLSACQAAFFVFNNNLVPARQAQDDVITKTKNALYAAYCSIKPPTK